MTDHRREFRRRLTDALPADDCGKGQHVLYAFLVEIDGILDRVTDAEKVARLAHEVACDALDQSKKARETMDKVEQGVERLQPLVELQGRIQPMLKLYEKAKSIAVLALGGYAIVAASPEARAFLAAWLAG